MNNALLLTAVGLYSFSTDPQVAEPHTWQVEYRDGMIETYHTPSYRLDFEERQYREWRLRYMLDSMPNSWSEWTRWFPANRLPGDTTGDCTVGAADVSIVGQNWGNRCE